MLNDVFELRFRACGTRLLCPCGETQTPLPCSAANTRWVEDRYFLLHALCAACTNDGGDGHKDSAPSFPGRLRMIWGIEHRMQAHTPNTTNSPHRDTSGTHCGGREKSAASQKTGEMPRASFLAPTACSPRAHAALAGRSGCRQPAVLDTASLRQSPGHDELYRLMQIRSEIAR